MLLEELTNSQDLSTTRTYIQALGLLVSSSQPQVQGLHGEVAAARHELRQAGGRLTEGTCPAGK